jgi:hypothetical protein
MAGNTGKMTTEAVIARGPRIRLTGIYAGTRRLVFVISREGDSIFCPTATARYSEIRSRLGPFTYQPYARSYSLPYLLRIGRAAQP